MMVNGSVNAGAALRDPYELVQVRDQPAKLPLLLAPLTVCIRRRSAMLAEEFGVPRLNLGDNLGPPRLHGEQSLLGRGCLASTAMRNFFCRRHDWRKAAAALTKMLAQILKTCCATMKN